MTVRRLIAWWTRPGNPGLGLATGVLGLSLGLLAWSGLRAFTLEQTAAEAAAVSPLLPPPAEPGERSELGAVLAAVDVDPFAPDRRRPARRFTLPDQRLAALQDSPAALSPQRPTLLGTAVLPDGRGFAVVQWGQEPPRLVRPGETASGLTLASVQQGRAVFTSAAGERVELVLPKPGS